VIHPPWDRDQPLRPRAVNQVRHRRPEADGAPDLQSQLEDLLGQVWQSEKWAALEARIDLSLGLDWNR